MRHGSYQGRRNNNNNNGGNGGQNRHRSGGQNRPSGSNQSGQRPHRNTVYDSNGPEARVRGTAFQINEKYLSLAKDASSSGDWILAESYLQHAEHYQRLINEFEQFEPRAPQHHNTHGHRTDQGDDAPENQSDTREDLGQAPNASDENPPAEDSVKVVRKTRMRRPMGEPSERQAAEEDLGLPSSILAL